MTTLREAAQMALEALDNLYLPGELERVNAAIVTLRAALAQEEMAEPVGWLTSPRGVFRENPSWKLDAPQSVWWRIPLYVAPPATPAGIGDDK